MKTCTKCMIEKPLDNFRISKTTGVVDSRCKLCVLEYNRAWIDKNREKTLEYSKKYYEGNKEKVMCRTGNYQKDKPEVNRKSVKKYKESNREKCNSYSRNYNKEHKELLKDYNIKWRNDNREQYNNRERHRRCLKKGLPGFHTTHDIEEAYIEQLGKCVYCKCSLKHGHSVDHIIPITREGSSDFAYNIQLLCKSCNSSKNNKTHEEYLEFLDTNNRIGDK